MKNNDTKERLLDSANILIKSVGVNAMSYADLSKEIGISKASIHHHFPKKEDLVIALLHRSNEFYSQKFGAIASSEGTGIEKLYAMAEVYRPKTCESKKCLLGMLSAEFASLGENVQRELQVSIRVPVRNLEKIFGQCIAEGSVHTTRSGAELAHAFYALILGAQLIAHSGNPDSFLNSISHFIGSL